MSSKRCSNAVLRKIDGTLGTKRSGNGYYRRTKTGSQIAAWTVVKLRM
jgi:hypothetical protein